MITLAAPASATEPGWGKLIALLIAIGIFWVGVQVHKRVTAVREGREIDPFSPDAHRATDGKDSQVSAPLEVDITPDRKGLRKWLRKG